MQLFDVYPLQAVNIVRGAGSWVWDANGRQYLDMYGGHAVISIGHSHPHWVQRIEDQLHQLAFYSNSVQLPLQAELAEYLGRLSGKPDYRLFLVNSGAEANENALKLASFHTGRSTILAFQNAFHGRTSLAVAATDDARLRAPINQHAEVVFLPLNDAAALEQAFLEREVAAVIVEGIQGVGGIRPAHADFLRLIRRCCDQYGAVYIADGIQCGYGRSGHFFSHDAAGVQADVYTVAKGMGNGFPVAGVLIGPQFQARHGMLGTTFGGNPLACAAALGVLEVIENEGLIERAAHMGAYLRAGLSATPGVTEVRGSGLMIGFEVSEEHRDLRKKLLEQHHIFTGMAAGNVIRLLPSLALSQQEADFFLENLHQAMQTAQVALTNN